jgi:putative oxidoreductase
MSRKTREKSKWSGMLYLAIRLVLAGTFVYAGVIKLYQPDTFLADIESYRMMPYSLAWLVAFYLPPLEIISGLALLWPRTRMPASLILIGMMLVFIVAITVAWARGLNISCGCFGTSAEETNYLWLIARDLLITGALVAGLSNFANTSSCQRII